MSPVRQVMPVASVTVSRSPVKVVKKKAIAINA
jgi:hypothetical protein